MDLLVELKFGSHLYGTVTPQSDLDLKSVYLPSGRDILLQRVRPTISIGRRKAPRERNVPGDVDRESYSLQRYMELLAEGQTVALDMLFAPDSAMTLPPSHIWREIQANADRLVSKRATVFVRYCRQQANRFGIKGSRVAAARSALALLTDAESRLGTKAKLWESRSAIESLGDESQHIALRKIPAPNGQLHDHLDVCDRRIPLSASLKTAREVVQRIVDEYGQRALQAERNEGVDWKALSHAVRVGREAMELFQTGQIRFPLDYANHLLRIKNGDYSYAVVADEIERLLEDVEAAAAHSALPASPDQALIDDIVARAYRQRIMEEMT